MCSFACVRIRDLQTQPYHRTVMELWRQGKWEGEEGSGGGQPGDEEIISLDVFKGSFEPGGVYGHTITRYSVTTRGGHGQPNYYSVRTIWDYPGWLVNRSSSTTNNLIWTRKSWNKKLFESLECFFIHINSLMIEIANQCYTYDFIFGYKKVIGRLP